MIEKRINKGELMFYLEEMLSMDTITDIEENIYYDLKYLNPINKSELLEVGKNMIEWYNTKF